MTVALQSRKNFMENPLLVFFINNFSSSVEKNQITLTKLFGQASGRLYYRVTLPSHFSPSSYVIMQYPPESLQKSDEASHSTTIKEMPFINIHRYLHQQGIAVPEILAHDAQHGLMLLEDLGDLSLENAILASTPELKKFYYCQVIETLVKIQIITHQNPQPQCLAFQREFDQTLLNWEFDHFLEYGIEDRKHCVVKEQDKKTFHTITREISAKIAKQPQGFVHRDFQSRNIMIHQMNFYLIDFQDALQGPILYDLVGLLRDSYIEFTPAEIDFFLSHYQKNLTADHPYFNRRDFLKEDFYTLALQRKLKDTGRFQFIDTVKNNPSFLKHVPLSLQYVKESFHALPCYAALQTMIAKYLEELL